MAWFRVLALCAVVCGGVLWDGCAGGRRAHSAPWRAGLAETDITPPIGFRMAGYFDERLSTGTHDPLLAKAIVLQQGREKVALVFCDLVGLSLDVSRKARADASRATGIPVTHIVVAATHSHTGPLFDDVRADYFHEDALARHGTDPHQAMDYPAFLRGRIVDAIVRANARLQPARLEAGVAQEARYPFNRRYYMKNGKVAFNPGHLNPKIAGPAGPVDHDVDMLFCQGAADGRIFGGLTVFAMHCDTIGATEFSADYPYYIQQSLRRALGSDFISAFGVGTCGDLNNIDVSQPAGNDKGFAVAQSIGDGIADAELAEMRRLESVERPSLAVKDKIMMMPLQAVTPDEIAAARVTLGGLRDPKVNFYSKVRAVKTIDLAQRGRIYPMEVQVIRLGAETAVVCLPAEFFVQFGLDIKKASPFKRTFVITVCNDRPCYVPTLKAFHEGSYEVINSRVEPGGGEAMAGEALELLRELKP